MVSLCSPSPAPLFYCLPPGFALVLAQDSFKHMQAGMLSDARFLQSIFAFSQNEKDFINDETIELMAPYLELDGFNPAVARNASKAAEGLCTWCRAMTYYHEASKVGTSCAVYRPFDPGFPRPAFYNKLAAVHRS